MVRRASKVRSGGATRSIAVLSLALLSLLTVGAFVLIGNMHRSVEGISKRELAVFDAAWRVRYLDEALTHSASEYALSGGSPEWRSRYDRQVEELDSVLAMLRKNASGSLRPIDAVEKANRELIRMEAEVFALTDKNEASAAFAVLSGPYREQKKLYQEGLDAFFDGQRAEIDKQLSSATQRSLLLKQVSILPGLSLATAVLLIARIQSRSARFAADRDRERNRVLTMQETDQRITQALDLTQTEDDVLNVVRDILSAEHRGGHVEVLLADSSRTHLRQVVVTDPTKQLPGCSVSSPHECPAIRRGTLLSFEDATSYSACAHLRTRDLAGCKATCVPISVMGQTVGVTHALEQGELTSDELHDNRRVLDRLSSQLGDRIGVMQTLNQSKLQAMTDPLTGLLNRRSLENRVREFGEEGVGYAVAFFDLDHFKTLNDTYGHETGDRGLRVFAKVLRDSLRSNDLICRWGGEEFLVVLPGADEDVAVLLSERVREALALSLAGGSVPGFTASGGVALHLGSEMLADVVARADGALLQAKRDGRNRVISAERRGGPVHSSEVHFSEQSL